MLQKMCRPVVAIVFYDVEYKLGHARSNQTHMMYGNKSLNAFHVLHCMVNAPNMPKMHASTLTAKDPRIPIVRPSAIYIIPFKLN